MTARAEPAADEQKGVEKAEWTRPTLTQFDPGDAEASDGPGPDGGLAS